MLPYPASARPALRRPEVVRSAVIVLTVLLVAAGVAAAVRPQGLPSELARRLPDTGRTDQLADEQGNRWQSSQGFMTVSQGVNGLNGDAQASLQWPADPHAAELDGRWFAVDFFLPDGSGGIHSENYLVDDGQMSLQATEAPTVWLTYSPGLPVLDVDSVPAGTTRWNGTVTLSTDGEHTRTGRASATVTVGPTPDRPGCLDSTAQIRYEDGSRATSTTTWCSGAAAGWAGQVQEQDSLRRVAAATSTPAEAADLTAPHADPRSTAGRSDQADTYRYVSGGNYQLPWVSIDHSTMAGRTLVTARSTGRLSGWNRYDHGPAARSNRYLVWRAWPGGVVTALTSVGSVTVAASTANLITGYGPHGAQLWQAETSDIATSLQPCGRSVLVVEATGRVRLLDARTGAERWSKDFTDDAEVATGANSVAVSADGELTVLDIATGRERWQHRSTALDAPVIIGDTVVSLQSGGTLLADSLQTGRPRWSRQIDPLAVLRGTSEQLIVRASSSMLSLAPDGSVRWRAQRTDNLAVDGHWTALSYPDRIELWNLDGKVRSWPLPAGVGTAQFLQVTESGVMAWGQPTPDGHRDREYR